MPYTKTPVILLGMHFCGLPALRAVVEAAGIRIFNINSVLAQMLENVDADSLCFMDTPPREILRKQWYAAEVEAQIANLVKDFDSPWGLSGHLNLVFIHQLAGTWPEARFILVTRHPNAMEQMAKSSQMNVDVETIWYKHHKEVLSYLSTPHFHTFRAQTLVNDPAIFARFLAAQKSTQNFFGIDPTSEQAEKMCQAVSTSGEPSFNGREPAYQKLMQINLDIWNRLIPYFVERA